jgi:hypothetical protein
MASNKIVCLGPVALTTTLSTDIFKPPVISGGTNPPPVSTNTYYIIRHIRIVNKTGSAATFSLWKNATTLNTAGKEVIGQGLSVAANSAFDWFGLMRLSSDETDNVIVGGSGTATALTIQAEAEMGVV